MKPTTLPRIQLVLALIFAIFGLFGAVLFSEIGIWIILFLLIGLILAGVTMRIGWLVQIQKQPVEYPFRTWSNRFLARFLDPREMQTLQQNQSHPNEMFRKVLGLGSLAVGALLMLATLGLMVVFLAGV